MLAQHQPHVQFAPPTLPHKGQPHTSRPPPRGILKKASSEPTSPSSPTFSWPLATPPAMPHQPHPFAASGYRPGQWSVLSITKAGQQQQQQQQRRRSSPSGSRTEEGVKSISLTVTLLYTPTETLYAWPFNLTSPDAKGVCYETHSHDEDGGAVRLPPEGTMSTSIRVLADVIRSWMKIRRERSMLAKQQRSTNSSTDGITSPTTSSIDQLVDDDEVVSEIIDTLRLHQLTPFERSIYLLRQALPEQPTAEVADNPQQPSWQKAASPKGRSPSSPGSSYQGSDDELDWRQRSDSTASSRASTVETSPVRSPQTRQGSSPKLPKINTAVASSPTEDEKTVVPQIRLHEATPQESSYEERDRTLERAAIDASRNSSFGGRSMATVPEDASEDYEANGSSASYDSGEVTFIPIQSCSRAETEEAGSPKSAVAPTSLFAPEIASSGAGKTNPPSSPTKVSFRDPFKSVKRCNSKGDIRIETIEHGSPDSLLNSTTKRDKSKTKFSKRPSLDGLRNLFGGRSKSQ